MKTREEQITEMAVIGCVRNPKAHIVEECMKCEFKDGFCNAYRHAEKLYAAGYRKQSDTVREFVDKLENANCEGNGILIVSEKTLNELAKEYGVEVEK